MMSFEQLAKTSYLAFQKEFRNCTGTTTVDWEHMPTGLQASWIAATKQLWAQFALTR